MSVSESIEKILIQLGKNNKPTIVAIGVAAAKGIFRPIFTMADKKQDKDSKKYTATRECLTEVIAIPVYWGSGKLAEFGAKKLAKPKEMASDVYKKILDGRPLENAEITKQAKGIRKNLFKMTTTLSMLGVFLSALLVIPAVCSVTIKPLMKAMQKTAQNNSEKYQITEMPRNREHTFKQKKLYNNTLYQNHFDIGMKVGGV